MIKTCIWMNIPSHYQSAFFQALDARDDVDLSVVYFNGASSDRAAEGWNSGHEQKAYEIFAEGNTEPQKQVERVEDWSNRVHIICGYFNEALIDFFCKRDVRWCHWSEKPGIRLAELLGYHMSLFRLLYPFQLLAKRSYGARIRNYALGAFGQGHLAKSAFQRMGVPAAKTADLYYSPGPLSPAEPCRQMMDFAAGRKIFLMVGALCKRKGIDVLLKAFSRIENNREWCIVFCGLDKADGAYKALSEKLGIQDQVLFLGAYPIERISEVYCAADVFVLPSRFDGWGTVFNEAASLGVPLIGTDLCGGSWHLIREGRTGYRVRAASAKSMSDALRKYINHPADAEVHGQAAKALFSAEFTPARNAERFVTSLKLWGAQ
ncbi:glycosyltransferase family 4 protein [Pontiella agarivorans]|uniref:Glycosyltransferase family 4 protein n=1 Tax=Pontiella agarivorans TaxID=3038953 RepID=A0ABU5MU49_9BACT|nr:glycosyltransferase family 4 protein [Pontiella agarivorans]MDZ8117743.1 glycosyltransferase family 4 protein [Pontiella agarivorans]